MFVNGMHYHMLDFLSGEVKQADVPLVLLHGFAGAATDFLFLAEAGFEVNRRCIAIDALGHGLSDVPEDPSRYRMECVVKDIDELIAKLNLQRIDLAGYSMGGRMALAYTLAPGSRVSRLVLESASPGLKSAAERVVREQNDAELAQSIEQAGIEYFVAKWEKLDLFSSQCHVSLERLARQRETRLSQSTKGLARSLLGAGTGNQPNYWDFLYKIDVPSLLLSGIFDQKFTTIAREMSMLLANAQYECLSGVGHNIHLENPALYSERVFGFLERTT